MNKSDKTKKYKKSGETEKTKNIVTDELRAQIRQLVKIKMNKIESNASEEDKRRLREEIRNDLLQGSESTFQPTFKADKEGKNRLKTLTSKVSNLLQIKRTNGSEPSKSSDEPEPSTSSGFIPPIIKSVEVKHDFECGICFDRRPTNQSVTYNCSHIFCIDCVREGLNTSITEGLIDSLKCPQPDCGSLATQTLIKKLVSDPIFKRYENLLLKQAIGSMDDVFYCPNPDCDTIIEGEIDVGMASCHVCELIFCTSCSKPYHGTSDCNLTDNDRQEMVQLHNDELLAEELLAQETDNELLFTAFEEEEDQRLERIRAEQEIIREEERKYELEMLALEEAQQRQREYEEQERAEREEQERQESERIRVENERRERDRIAFERQQRENEERERQKQAINAEKRNQDMASENLIRGVCKLCPGCRAPIQKNEGCVHMTCIKCRHEFCWNCMRRWEGYHHICPT